MENIKRVYTADDEMPDCGRCDHICDGFKCDKSCGPEHGWWGYCRTEVNWQKGKE